jgi:hypothetical protein
MKSLLDFKSITEEEKKDYSKFDALVRAGLANKAQVQRIHKILDKMGDERPTFSPADRAIMQNLFNRMVDLISNNKQIYTKARQAVREDLQEASASMDVPFVPDPPAVLVIRRRAVRLYPDGTRVALYFSDKLKRYFTVPYATSNSEVSAIQAESFIDELRAMSNLTENTLLELEDGSQIELDASIVEHILYAYDGLKEENREKFVNLLTSSAESFDKAYEFCRSHYSV